MLAPLPFLPSIHSFAHLHQGTLSAELFQKLPSLYLHRTGIHLCCSFILIHLSTCSHLLPVFQKDSFLPSAFLFCFKFSSLYLCLFSGFSGRWKANVPNLPSETNLYGGFGYIEFKKFFCNQTYKWFLLFYLQCHV